jgi:hypothetical protein
MRQSLRRSVFPVKRLMAMEHMPENPTDDSFIR